MNDDSLVARALELAERIEFQGFEQTAKACRGQ